MWLLLGVRLQLKPANFKEVIELAKELQMDNQDTNFLVYNLTTGLDSWAIQDALISVFNNGVAISSAALGYARVLTYLIKSYLGFQNTPAYIKYDGFMVKTPKDMSVYCQLSYDTCKAYPKCFKEMGFIDVKTGGAKNRTLIKVNLDKIAEAVNRERLVREQEISDYRDKQSKNHKEEIQQIKNREISYEDKFNKLIDYCAKDEPPEDGDINYLKELGFSALEMQLVYFVNSVYKEVYKKDFPWQPGELFTLRSYFGRNNFLNGDKRNEIRKAIETLDKLTFQKEAHLSTRIIERMKGLKDWNK